MDNTSYDTNDANTQYNNSDDNNNQSRPSITQDKLKEFIVYIITSIVTQKDQVDISVEEDVTGSFTVTIKVAQEDKGRVIGKKGSTINSLRTLIRVFGKILILVQD